MQKMITIAEQKQLLTDHPILQGRILKGDPRKLDSPFTSNFYQTWQTDAVVALVFCPMGDRDSYPGNYILAAISQGIIEATQVEDAFLIFLDRWKHLDQETRNNRAWWSPLEEAVGSCRGSGFTLPRLIRWINENRELLESYPHLNKNTADVFRKEISRVLDSKE